MYEWDLSEPGRPNSTQREPVPTGSAVEGGEEWKCVAGGKRVSDEEHVCEDVRDGVCRGAAER